MTETGQPSAAAQPPIDDIATFLQATATALRETVARFEKTSARITENLALRAGTVDHDLIVTLQDFDRLQQEFTTLADVLARAATKSGVSWRRVEGGAHPAEDTIATISIADLKERLMRHLGFSMPGLAPPAAADEVVF